MAHIVFKDPFVSINSVTLSSHVQEVRLDYSADTPEDTAGGDNTRSRLAGGLKDWSISVTFFQDYAAAQVDATLFSIVGSAVPIELRPASGAASATNPKYTGSAILSSYQPMGGAIGDAQQAPVTLAGSGDLTRATA